MRKLVRLLIPLGLFLAMLLPAGGATAAPAEATRSETFAAVVNECNGFDHVGLSGTIIFVEKHQADGSVIVNLNIHGQGLSSQGNEYVMNFTAHARADGSTDDRILLVSKGSLPNQMLIFHFDPQTGSSFEAVCTG